LTVFAARGTVVARCVAKGQSGAEPGSEHKVTVCHGVSAPTTPVSSLQNEDRRAAPKASSAISLSSRSVDRAGTLRTASWSRRGTAGLELFAYRIPGGGACPESSIVL